MPHIQSGVTLQGVKYRIEQKARYLKIYLTNPADSVIIKNCILLLGAVDIVNITNQHTGDLTVHHASKKANAEMQKDVEQALQNYYSYASLDNISLQQTRRLVSILDKNTQEKRLLESAIDSYNRGEYRHAFDDYRLCLEYVLRKILQSNEGMKEMLKKLKDMIKSKGFTAHLCGAIIGILNKFEQYQNENVKHYNNISLIDTMTIFTWGNMLLEQMILLNKMLNRKIHK